MGRELFFLWLHSGLPLSQRLDGSIIASSSHLLALLPLVLLCRVLPQKLVQHQRAMVGDITHGIELTRLLFHLLKAIALEII